MRGVWRLVRCAGHIAAAVVRCAVVFPFIPPAQRMRHTGRWCARMAALLGLDIRTDGRPHEGPVLVVANHVSWLDILAINAVRPVRFVSKADVRAWPLLGWLVACGGTLFIERERKRDALRVVHQIAAALQQGDAIGVFPEGTTGDGRAVLPFHANLLQSAIATHMPVQPVALAYADADAQPSEAVVWLGDTTLVQSLWWVVTAHRLQVSLKWLPPMQAAGRERRDLSAEVRGQIGQALGLSDS